MLKISYERFLRRNHSVGNEDSEGEFYRKKGFTLIELMVVIGVIGILTSIVLPRFTGSTDAAKAAQVHGNLHNIQEAIDMFNVSEGHYPEHGRDIGAGSEGNAFSETFEKYYSKGRMPETPAGGRGISAERVDRERVYEWEDRELQGGWLYNESEGKLYARLVEDSYGQGNIWISDEELNGGSTTFLYEGRTLWENGTWFSEETFDEYTLKTTFGIDDVGRIEVYLGGKDGYQLWIHPKMAKVILRDEAEREVATGSLKDLGIDMNTWYDAPEGVPVEVRVSNTHEGQKSLTLKIDGKTVMFDGNESVTYDPISEEDGSVGIVNIKRNRPVEMGDTTITVD